MNKKIKERNQYLLQLVEKSDIEGIKRFYKEFSDHFKNKLIEVDNWTPIKLACRFGNYNLLKLLLEFGMKIESEDISTLLLLTCYSNNNEVFVFLLNYKDKFDIIELNSLCSISLIFKKINFTFLFLLFGAKIMDDIKENEWYPINFDSINYKNDDYISVKDKKFNKKIIKTIKNEFYKFKFKLILKLKERKEKKENNYFKIFEKENSEINLLKREIENFL